MSKYLSIDTNAKTVKGRKKGYMTGILYLAPANQSGAINTCPHASDGCRAACLYTAGRGAFDSVKNARIKKTLAFVADRGAFVDQLAKDVAFIIRKAKREDMTPCIRLNGTSDLPWENWGIMQKFPDITFYDYTKNPNRMRRYLAGEMPANYHLTFSRSESNHAACADIAKRGGNIAAVFTGKELPTEWEGRKVISGDESDLRFTDPQGVWVGLKAKGKARKDQSGFAIENN